MLSLNLMKTLKHLINKLKLDKKKNISLVIWTTTPWTIPGNQSGML